ncbi:MAG: 2Fe-2S iron-sulfur cluster binding domain-containing protein [Syntrophorhabdus sp.]|nr:2Fe-2S iron-sulfur cluster binding domain-containing protein [Syntrophorhabdus sp.]
MSDILLTIDGKEVRAKEGMTVLNAAQSSGIFIPTLCHHEKLEPYGGCRICTVEVESRGRTNYVASCLYPVEKNLVVRTRSEKIDKIRKVLIELLLAHAPDSPQLLEMAKEYGAKSVRFGKEPSFCVLCGLCVRYCAEVKKKNAIAFVDQGPKREINFIPEIASKECWNCKECFPLCPTSYLQAAYVLTQGLVGFKYS